MIGKDQTNKRDRMTYGAAGIQYSEIDPFKVQALREALKTTNYIADIGLSELPVSRGESVHLVETPRDIIGHVNESLGTKILVADAMYKLTGNSLYYYQVAQCAFAMIANDLITLGARPLSANMFLAAGDSGWFQDAKRYTALLRGWKQACDFAGCVWGGGETPVLPGIVNPETIVLAGSIMGIIAPKSRLVKPNVKDGDVIILLESSGIHSNGLTLAREISKKLSEGYLTKMSDGTTYGGSLLTPTTIYAEVVKDCLDRDINIHYMVNITGHGWRKIARFPESFVYVIEKIFEPQPVFSFMQEYGSISDQEMYETFNMGAGYAIFVPESEVIKVLTASRAIGIPAIRAGYVKKRGVQKKVVILPKGGLELGEAKIRIV